jgi:hypothetical protein
LVNFPAVDASVTGATGTTSISTSRPIWLQGYEQTTNPDAVVVVPSWLYFDNSGSVWVVAMGVSALSSGSNVGYTISYYSV